MCGSICQYADPRRGFGANRTVDQGLAGAADCGGGGAGGGEWGFEEKSMDLVAIP